MTNILHEVILCEYFTRIVANGLDEPRAGLPFEEDFVNVFVSTEKGIISANVPKGRSLKARCSANFKSKTPHQIHSVH